MNDKLKILMIPTWYSARDAEVMFAGVFHYEQAMALKEYADTAIYFPYDMNYEGGFTKAEEKGMLTFRRGARLAFLRPIFYVLDYMRICKCFKPDIIHGHVGLGAGVAAVLLGKLFRVPVVITEHNPLEMMGFDDPKRIDLAKSVYVRSNKNVCVSRHQMECLQEYFPEEEFQLIHNGVYDPMDTEPDGIEYAKEGCVNACIAAGFYSKDIKGYQYLIPAIKKLVNEGVAITLHIAGDGDYFEYYRDMVRDLGIEENCIFYGMCDKQKMYSIMKQMDFIISASLYESAGVTVQEAQLLGKPVLVTKSGGANSLVTDFSAVVVDKGSTEALVDGIKKMVEVYTPSILHESACEGETKQLRFDSKQIREYAISQFEIDQVSQKYMEVYHSVCKK